MRSPLRESVDRGLIDDHCLLVCMCMCMCACAETCNKECHKTDADPVDRIEFSACGRKGLTPLVLSLVLTSPTHTHRQARLKMVEAFGVVGQGSLPMTKSQRSSIDTGKMG